MATQVVSRAALQTLLAEAADYLAASNWSGARSKCAQAQAVLSGLAFSASDQGTQVQYQQNLKDLLAAIDQAQASAQAAQTTDHGTYADLSEFRG